MEHNPTDETYMRRCLQLAGNGLLNAKPNPMVGAVIVGADGRIIGEGYHVRCGEGHAEVNAFASVSKADEALLPEATLYVSLEPCSHYGQGRGIQKLRDAGIDVTVGVLEKECKALNKRFFTFNTHKRPYVILKWCMTANGYIDDGFKPTMLSTPFTQMLCHKLRAENDAILVGRVTDERDRPRLDVRLWSGPDPLRLTLDRNRPFSPDADFSRPVIPQLFSFLHGKGVQSLIVEGGAETLGRFMDDDNWWDEIRVETSPKSVTGGTRAPQLPQNVRLSKRAEYDGNVIETYVKDED